MIHSRRNHRRGGCHGGHRGAAMVGTSAAEADFPHWFSVLHGMAISLLQVTQLDLDEGDHFFERTLKSLIRA